MDTIFLWIIEHKLLFITLFSTVFSGCGVAIILSITKYRRRRKITKKKRSGIIIPNSEERIKYSEQDKIVRAVEDKQLFERVEKIERKIRLRNLILFFLLELLFYIILFLMVFSIYKE